MVFLTSTREQRKPKENVQNCDDFEEERNDSSSESVAFQVPSHTQTRIIDSQMITDNFSCKAMDPPHFKSTKCKKCLDGEKQFLEQEKLKLNLFTANNNISDYQFLISLLL